MDNETLENQDSETPEEAQDSNLENESQEEQSEVEKLKEIARNQEIRAKKAEQELKALKKAPKEKETPEKTSNEPDYAKLAFLEQRGIKHPDDQKAVFEEAERLKLPITDVLGMEHLQTRLKNANDQREAQDGTPQGKGMAKGRTQGDVEYWLAKGETPDDLELANKVIDARMKKEEAGNKFSETLY